MSIWDFDKYEKIGDGVIEDLFLPSCVYELFFKLNKKNYYFLSGLSLFEYDVFRVEMLDDLLREINELGKETENISIKNFLEKIKTIILKAKQGGNAIIFDPFR